MAVRKKPGSSQQGEQSRINELAIFAEVFPQKSLLPEAAFFQDASRRRVVREDMGGDLRQPEFFEGVPAHSLYCGSHDAAAPIRLRQPVTNLGKMRLTDGQAVKPDAAD